MSQNCERDRCEVRAEELCGAGWPDLRNPGASEPAPGYEPKYFVYRSSSYITEFFQELDTDWTHDGSIQFSVKPAVHDHSRLDAMTAGPADPA
jgi:hypothetical protein